MPKTSKVSPATKTARGQLSKLSKIKIQGNKQVPIVLRAIFSNYDTDASGSISKKEMAALVMDLQSLLPGTPAHLKHCANVVSKIAMAALDIDGGGTIDEDEFVEWCQSNLFLTPEDRATVLVSNMDLSQFITALEMCVKMQLAGIGPYNYYTPPPPSCAQKHCTTTNKIIFCLICIVVFITTCILVFLLILVPNECQFGEQKLCAKKAKSRTKKSASTDSTGSTSPGPSAEGELASDSAASDSVAPAPGRRMLVASSSEGGGLRPATRLERISELPKHMHWEHWENWGKIYSTGQSWWSR